MSRKDRGLVQVVGKQFTACHRHARISPFKARPVIDLVRGKPVEEALSILEFQPQRAAPMIRKVILSAKATASNDLEVKLGRLVVTEACVDGGPLLGGRPRFMARAMGRAFPIRKRTSHITVTLAEAEVARASSRGARKATKRSGAKAPDTKAGTGGGAAAQGKE